MIITAGIYKGRKLVVPDKKITRPTLSKVRMGVFNTLYSLLGDFTNKSFLDVFGGSGIMGLEAISRGFSEVQVFELNKQAASIIKKNYEQLGLIANLHFGDSIKLVQKNTKTFDVAYIDPPYNTNLYEEILPHLRAKIVVIEGIREIVYDKSILISTKRYGNKFVTYMEIQNCAM